MSSADSADDSKHGVISQAPLLGFPPSKAALPFTPPPGLLLTKLGPDSLGQEPVEIHGEQLWRGEGSDISGRCLGV